MKQVLDVTCVQIDQLMVAIPSDDVLGVVRPKISIVPSTNSWFEGTAIYEDEIVPVVNLCKFINGEPRTSRFTYIAIGYDGLTKAIIGVSRLITKVGINDTEIIEINGNGTLIDDHTLGFVKTETRDWAILNINSLLSDERIVKVGIQ